VAPAGEWIAVRASLAVLAAACGSGGQKVYVQGAYKPKQVVLGAGTPIKDVRWLSYGGSHCARSRHARRQRLPAHLRFGPHHLGAHLVQCRIEELSEKLRGLEARGEEFALGDEDMPEPLSEEDVQALAAQVREVIAQGERRQRKALLQSFVQEIRVVSRAEIYPFFFVPAFRPPCGSVPPPRIELGHAV
jgi:hypothetical protein